MPIVVLKTKSPNVPQRLDVIGVPKTGGEGNVYFTRDGKFAVKIYHEAKAKREEKITRIMGIFDNLPPAQQEFILPPLGLVKSFDGKTCIGFAMRRVPSEFKELLDFVIPTEAAKQFQSGLTWANYLRVARSTVNAVNVLHNKGCGHSDIQFRNFLVNLNTGAAVMLEIDGVFVPSGPDAYWEKLEPGVKGLAGFMAPEILAQSKLPNKYTDCHSLPVLILHTLLFRNVMQPLIEYADEVERSEELGWGEKALFSEHPNDRRHRPRNIGQPFYKRGALSYKMLPPTLQHLTEQALIHALHNPSQRPSAKKWAEALACAVDELWKCPTCGQHFPYQYSIQEIPRRHCPFCGERVHSPYPAVLDLYEEKSRSNFFPINRRLVLGPGFRLWPDMLEKNRYPPHTRQGVRPVGSVELDRAGQYRLINDEDDEWVARTPSGQKFAARRGQSLPLSTALLIRFGDKRRAYVLEVGR